MSPAVGHGPILTSLHSRFLALAIWGRLGRLVHKDLLGLLGLLELLAQLDQLDQQARLVRQGLPVPQALLGQLAQPGRLVQLGLPGLKGRLVQPGQQEAASPMLSMTQRRSWAGILIATATRSILARRKTRRRSPRSRLRTHAR